MNCNLCNLLAMAKKLLPDDGSRSTCKGARNNTGARYKHDSPFFHSPKHGRDFAVHPDWVSERLMPRTQQPYPFSVRTNNDVTTAAPRGRSMNRRAASANAVHRDPITWRNWYRSVVVYLACNRVHVVLISLEFWLGFWFVS